MVKWIHVITASKLPIPRGNHSSPYELYDDGFNPNVDTPFGPDKESMFLEVQDQDRPVVNDVLEQVNPVQTIGADGISYHGEYLDPYWVGTWEISEQDMDESRALKISLLEEDRDSFVAIGYAVGPFAFPLTEHFFRLLADRLRWLEEAIAALEVPSNTSLTFSDLADKEVSVGINTLKNHFVLFGKEYLGMYEKEVAARDQIEEAVTVGEVDSVTWSF